MTPYDPDGLIDAHDHLTYEALDSLLAVARLYGRGEDCKHRARSILARIPRSIAVSLGIEQPPRPDPEPQPADDGTFNPQRYIDAADGLTIGALLDLIDVVVEARDGTFLAEVNLRDVVHAIPRDLVFLLDENRAAIRDHRNETRRART